jgi:hypothetical protein
MNGGRYEEAGVIGCTDLAGSGITRCGASHHPKWSIWSERRDSINASANNRHFLHRGNDSDFLQRGHRPEHQWLWHEERCRIEQQCWVCQPLRIGRHGRHQIVDSALLGGAAIQRTM